MTMGRPLEFDPDAALAKAMDVFWAQGYDATSLQDLMSATGLSKSSLYGTYESKIALFARSVDNYVDQQAANMKQTLDNSASARQFIESSFLGLADEAGKPSAKKGCLVWNTALEFGQRDKKIAGRVKRGIRRFTDLFTNAVRRAQQEGDIDSTKDPGALGTYLVSSMGGVRLMLKSGVDRTSVDHVVEQILHALD